MGKYYRTEYEIIISGKSYRFPTLKKLRQFVKKPEIMSQINDCKHKVRKHLYCDKPCGNDKFAWPVSMDEFYLFDMI